MSLFEQLTEDMKSALKAGEKERLSTIRLLRGYIKNESIEKRRELTEAEEIAVLLSAAKKRKESIQAYGDAGRAELVAKESAELAVIQSYLPQPLSPEEIEKIIEAAIAEAHASSLHDLGKVMPIAIKMVGGRADGREINAIVRQKLAV
ncbi:GatB/YqeY domain-containing protein [candidate division KSB1 bacterium]|nr:GatB/YqeY domain-containing protein [candidate division KSB1 bacterium]RQW07569.1 MAG: GatB/YqeY domain-containing protein [candidate division KSB1 bacterium]